jgi:GNAT superfamily N-acetyltransferase
MSANTPLPIRVATRSDAPALYQVHQQAVRVLCASYYSAAVIARWMEKRTVEGYYPALDQGVMVVYEAGDQVIGFGHAVPGEVLALFTHPDHARQGVGSALLRECLAMARREHTGPIRLQSTLNACDFYAHRGFREIARYDVVINHTPIAVVEMELPG